MSKKVLDDCVKEMNVMTDLLVEAGKELHETQKLMKVLVCGIGIGPTEQPSSYG